MNHFLKYRFFIEKEIRISRNDIIPNNIYKISLYRYKDEGVKSLPPPESSLIFVIGIYDKRVNCLKLNNINPILFFNWLKTIKRKEINEESIKNKILLSDLLIKTDLKGTRLFESYIKNKPIYNVKPSPYRTYELTGIRYVSEVKLKDEHLKVELL